MSNFKSIGQKVWEGGYGLFMGAQNLVFPIDVDRRPYNSVTHYRATGGIAIRRVCLLVCVCVR